jgi:hypothetical protein
VTIEIVTHIQHSDVTHTAKKTPDGIVKYNEENEGGCETFYASLSLGRIS